MGGLTWRLVALRAAQSLLVVFVVVSIVFAVSRATGDPVTIMAPMDATQEDIERIQEKWGLNDPLVVQYVRFLGDTAQLDMGDSYRTGRPATEEVVDRLPASLKLGGAALAFSLVAGIPLGVVAALSRGTSLDILARAIALAGQATPNFWLGIMLILFFAVRLDWLPTGGDQGIRSLILPAITLGAASTAAVVRLIRSGMIEVMSSDFVRTARAKGVSENVIVRRHALRHALLPVLSVFGIQVGNIFSGTIIIETVFSWPGIGRLMIQSINSADYPVVQVAVVFIAVSIVLANFLVDVSYRFVDPRVKAGV